MGKDPEEAMESADNASRSGADELANKDPGCDNSQFFAHLNQNGDQGTGKLARDFGRLVVEEGRSRYVANKFWTALSEEVRELHCGTISFYLFIDDLWVLLLVPHALLFETVYRLAYVDLTTCLAIVFSYDITS